MRSRLFLIVCLAMAYILPSGLAAPLPPEKAVTLDFSWLSPPVIAPSSAWGNVMRIGDAVRLSSRPGTAQPTYTWSLRYPISVDDYPTLVIRYRASRIGLATEPLLAAELSPRGAFIPVLQAAELAQDGSIQELRKDLRPLPPGASIGRLTFTLPPAVTSLDIIELRFEPGSDMGNAYVPVRQNMQFSIVDEYNRPVADASVVAGPLERANWVTEGRTAVNGQVSLAVISPTAAGDAAGRLGLVLPTEVAVMRPGYTPQYISSIDIRPHDIVAVRLTRAGELPADASPLNPTVPEPPAPVAADEPSYAGTQNYYYYDDDDDYYDDYYDRRYRYGYPYGYWPGYVLVIVKDKDQSDNGGTPGNGNGNGDDPDHRTPPPPLPPAPIHEVPWAVAPSQGVTSVPRYGVSTTPTYGVTPVPRFGVQTAPRFGVTPVPSQRVITAPSQRVVPAPGTPIMSAPTDRTPIRSSRDARIRLAPVDRTPAISRSDSRSRSVSGPARINAPSRDISRSGLSSRGNASSSRSSGVPLAPPAPARASHGLLR